jgi:hypothetical protein
VAPDEQFTIFWTDHLDRYGHTPKKISSGWRSR